jgi:hypothetical protein
MRRRFLKWVVALTVTGSCAASSVLAENGKSVSFESVKRSWNHKAVMVTSGGLKPSIEKLTGAFCQVWPTIPCRDLLLYLKDPERFNALLGKDTGYAVTVDRSNGFLMVADNKGGDSAYLYATLWRLKNGHTLFSVKTGQPGGAHNIDAVVFYDYDPSTKRLSPNKRLHDRLTAPAMGKMQWIHLPREGKDIKVSGYHPSVPKVYTFKFNGLGFDEPTVSDVKQWD